MKVLFGCSLLAALLVCLPASARGHSHHHSAHPGRHCNQYGCGHRHHVGHAISGHAGHFVHAAVGGAGAAVGRDVVNGAPGSRSHGANHSSPDRATGPGPQAAGKEQTAAPAYCDTFLEALKHHGSDAAYAARLRQEAPECF